MGALLLLGVVGSAAAAGADAPPKPSDGAMMSRLYNDDPASVAIYGERPCLKGGCSVSIRATDNWFGQDGKYRQAIVAAIELDDAIHAAGGIVGIAVFRWDDTAWVPEVRTPAVTSIGSFGRFQGKVEVVHLPGSDPVFIAHNAGMNEGAIGESASILVNILGSYKDVLDIITAHDTGAYCADAEPSCLEKAKADDFRSDLSMTADPGGGFDVRQIFSAGLPRPTKTWHIGSDGNVR